VCLCARVRARLHRSIILGGGADSFLAFTTATGTRMNNQGSGDIPSLSTMSDLGAVLPPGNGGTTVASFCSSVA
jgi:hypothetical protein